MAVNKVQRADGTVEMDITDTTALPEDVSEGEVFYGSDGLRKVGSGRWMEPVSDPTVNEVLITDANGQAIGSGVLIDNVVQITDLATETIAGLVKLNPSENVTLNSDGQLDVGGRLGQMPTTTGIYSPKTINPASIGNGSLLVTEASGLTLGPKSLAVVTGNGISLKTAAAAGATTYVVKNTYENRVYCAGLLGATVAKDEASAAETFVTVTNVTAGGYAPSNNNYWSSEADIIITTNKSINPDSSISSIRVYYISTGFSNMTAGQMVGHKGGASVAVGQRVFGESGNACALVGASIYNKGNGNAVFGRQHISKKNRSFLAGTGHDTTNGPSEGVAAVGQWSDIKSDTSFAIGNGTSDTNRSNSFEVDTAGDTFINGYLVMKSPNGTQYKISVDDNGNLVTSAL